MQNPSQPGSRSAAPKPSSSRRRPTIGQRVATVIAPERTPGVRHRGYGPAAMEELVLYEVDGRVATVTLNRPEKLNAITPELQGELLRALEQAAGDSAVHVAVVRGAGRAFSAGYDVTSGGMAASGVPADRI